MAIQAEPDRFWEGAMKSVFLFGGYLIAQYTIENPLSDIRLRLVSAGLSAIGNASIQVNFRNLREYCGMSREVAVLSCLRPREFFAGFVAGQAFLGGLLYSFNVSTDVPMIWGVLPAVSFAYLLGSEFMFHSVKQCVFLIRNRQERPLEVRSV